MNPEDLVPYRPETLEAFLDGLGTFAPEHRQISLENTQSAELLGRLHLDEEVPVVALEVEDATKKRRKDWEPAARYLLDHSLLAGLFVFHDERSAYRLSLIHARYRGKAKPELSHYRRQSLIAEPGRPNKTFFQRLKRLEEAPPQKVEDLLRAFSVEAVTEEFYREFIEVFRKELVPGVVGGSRRG